MYVYIYIHMYTYIYIYIYINVSQVSLVVIGHKLSLEQFSHCGWRLAVFDCSQSHYGSPI